MWAYTWIKPEHTTKSFEKTSQGPGGEITELISRRISQMICTDLQPYSIVEWPGFRKLITALAPNYELKWAFLHHQYSTINVLRRRHFFGRKISENYEIFRDWNSLWKNTTRHRRHHRSRSGSFLRLNWLSEICDEVCRQKTWKNNYLCTITH